MHLFNNIAIIGLGLIGSSIARAVKKYEAGNKVTAYDSNIESINKAIALNYVDAGYATIDSSLQEADLIIICTPISTYEDIFKQISPNLSKTAILTDVGSVKNAVIKIAANNLINPEMFVPAHPIAGSEKSGLLAGKADLFKNKEFIISPSHESSEHSIAKVQEFWEKLGSKVETLAPDKHDEIYAKSSHIPHLIAFCYAKFITNKLRKPLSKIIEEEGDEFAAFVRLAFSNPRMWTDIFLYNKEPIISNTQVYFSTQKDTIKNESDIEKLFNRIEESRKARDELNNKQSFTKKIDPYNTDTGFLPILLSCNLIESVDGHPRVGGGFLGMTQVAIEKNEEYKKIFYNNYENYNLIVKNFYNEIEKILAYIKSSNSSELYNYINSATLYID